ncbi:MAG: hypothetical protein JXB49_08860, partial [Bacteroidales bacterium]|nr:hypothetical protein [Bacteroidales bacterium]
MRETLMTKYFKYKFIVSLLLIFSNCSTGTKSRINCICLIDYSGSLSESTIQNYAHIISNNIWLNLSEYDRLIVIPIDLASKIEPEKIVYEDLSEHKFSRDTDGFTHASDSTQKRLIKYLNGFFQEIERKIIIQRELRRRYTDKTDIISALEQASRLLERNDTESSLQIMGRVITGRRKLISENVIVLFSDMIHESEEFTFSTAKGPSDGQIEKILDELSNRNR